MASNFNATTDPASGADVDSIVARGKWNYLQEVLSNIFTHNFADAALTAFKSSWIQTHHITNGAVTADKLAAGAASISGQILMYGAAAAPTGYLLCDGTAVSRTTYATLFGVISTTYGVGDGSTTFNVPDMRGRMPLGLGTGSGLTARSLNDQPGAETFTLAEANMPAHAHQEQFADLASPSVVTPATYSLTGGGGAGGKPVTGDTTAGSVNRPNLNTLSAGSGTAKTHQGPGLCVNFIIKT